MKRPRVECPYCKEILSYSSYRRHVETKLCVKKPESVSIKAVLDGHKYDSSTELHESLDFSGIGSHYQEDTDTSEPLPEVVSHCCFVSRAFYN